jgi:hypothetical protein
MVNLGPPHQVVTHAGTSAWEHTWFSGLHERAIVIESLHGTHLVAARLHPLGAWRLFGPDIAGTEHPPWPDRQHCRWCRRRTAPRGGPLGSPGAKTCAEAHAAAY